MRGGDNVDAAEIAKFDALADYWWDRHGVLQSLHDINPLRLAYIDRCAPLNTRRVLDVGCGGGILSEAMAAMGAQVTGIDMAPGALRIARSHAAGGGFTIDYRQSSAEAFAREHPAGYDRVVCLELLEHVDRPAAIVTACSRLVRPGGDVIFATLDKNVIAWLFAIFGAEYVLRLLARGTHQYARFIAHQDLKRWAQSVGLQCRDLTWMHYNPFTRRYFLRRNGWVNYLIHFKKTTG